MIGRSDAVSQIPVPPRLGAVIDLAPVRGRDRPIWLTLSEDGMVGRWDVASGDHETLAATEVPEEDRETWGDFELRRHLHASHDGMFAAVVNDFGRFGEVVDLQTGDWTLQLDNHGDNQGDNEETVPFSLEFAQSRGRCVVIHRTGWNRLDVSDARTGALLTDRSIPAPEHDLDYFHGALYMSPDGKRVLDDGWVWHPVGFPVVWDFDPWVEGNVWESEDGPSRLDVCDRGDAWNHGMTWIDSARVAVVGISDVYDGVPSGARIFDTSRAVQSEPRSPLAVELLAFEGPTGRLFSDGTHLFSGGDTDLSIWDPAEGKLLGTVAGFSPTHYHPGARQFLRLDDGVVRLWTA
ncbi:hypothetical protein [Streptomyces sp. NPDC087859]|uniref:hypothetical protein n=1 Tax=Streptomyces sp. NPDC087859 TaxID=3365812 RepID=UPI003800454D